MFVKTISFIRSIFSGGTGGAMKQGLLYIYSHINRTQYTKLNTAIDDENKNH
jgi:hypothetical protein